jgi:hypothetical protein
MSHVRRFVIQLWLQTLKYTVTRQHEVEDDLKVQIYVEHDSKSDMLSIALEQLSKKVQFTHLNSHGNDLACDDEVYYNSSLLVC